MSEIIEPRILKCLCGNILRLDVCIVDGEERYLATADSPQGEKSSVVLNYRRRWHKHSDRGRLSWSKSVSITSGATSARERKFVHCRNCYRRVTWKRFQKADV